MERVLKKVPRRLNEAVADWLCSDWSKNVHAEWDKIHYELVCPGNVTYVYVETDNPDGVIDLEYDYPLVFFVVVPDCPNEGIQYIAWFVGLERGYGKEAMKAFCDRHKDVWLNCDWMEKSGKLLNAYRSYGLFNEIISADGRNGQRHTFYKVSSKYSLACIKATLRNWWSDMS